MSKFYDDVKKQGTQIDDLQKKVTDHGTRIETLETQAMATPPQSLVNIPAPKVTVTVPDNIATKENINSLLETAIEKQTKITVKTISDMFKMLFPNGNAPQGIDDAKLEEIAQKAADKAASKRHAQLEATAETLMHRMYNLVNGAIWAAIPKWVYIVFAIAVLAAGSFGYGFFYQLNDNSKLKDVEWLYRYERGLNHDLNVVMHRERLLIHGKPHEVDSLKSLIRYHEQRVNADTTFIYYYPSNK